MVPSMRIAITGLGPNGGALASQAIAAGIRASRPEAVILGLSPRADEGAVTDELSAGPNLCFPMPPVSQGAEAYLRRLHEIRRTEPFEALIPTQTDELDLLVMCSDELRKMGVRTCLPDGRALHLIRRENLAETAQAAGVSTPRTEVVFTLGRALVLGRELGYPLIAKGKQHDSQWVECEAELAGAVSLLFAQWGAPVLLQEVVPGPEHRVIGMGDGLGGLVGLCMVRLSPAGPWGGVGGSVTVDDGSLRLACQKVITALEWRGPFEMTWIEDERSHQHLLIKLQPCFPSWVGFPTGFGLNFPAVLAEFAASGEPPAPMPEARPGWFHLHDSAPNPGQACQPVLAGGAAVAGVH